MAGREVPIEWNGRRALAWVPDPLADQQIVLAEATVRKTEQAAAAAQRVTDLLPPGWEPLARLLLRAEGVASSYIEGVRAPLPDVAAAELDSTFGETADWVANNLAVVASAVAAGHGDAMSVGLLHSWHARLMQGPHAWLPAEMVGSFRTAQGWVGGTSPLDAALVTPPPDRVPGLMDDLVAYVNRLDVDPVTQAAAAHAQFECIHPYGDGNGRIGRVLVGWLLVRRLDLAVPPPISVPIAIERGGYLAGLTQFRLGEVDQWVRWFADVVRNASTATLGLFDRVRELTEQWEVRLTDVRADSAAHRLIHLLPQHPVLSAATVAAELGVSERAARSALAILSERGIIEPFAAGHSPPGRPRHWWIAPHLLAVVSSWSGT
jgi:Fic family protein